jgi:hypothetical protein
MTGKSKKSAAAAMLGRRGGKACAKRLTAEELSAIGCKAVQDRRARNREENKDGTSTKR